MNLLILILLIVAFLCALVDAFGLVASSRVHFLGLAIALFLLVEVLRVWPT